MKIGLMRHFKVKRSKKTFLTADEFEELRENYKQAEPRADEGSNPKGEEVEWEKCFSSSLPRAKKTAGAVYNGEVIEKECLREVPLAPVTTKNIVLPHSLWLILGRLVHFFSHSSQPETREETKERARQCIAEILEQEESKILVVTHGFLIRFLQKELLNRGFSGDKFTYAKHGDLYVFEKRE